LVAAKECGSLTQCEMNFSGHRAGGRRFEDSTIGSESDARLFSDDDDRSRVSTSTDITSVSRQHHMNAYRKRRNRRKFRQPSRASSFSSITESSMSLDVITVTLNMDTVNFLGISIVGQSSSRGDNGIYVANIMKGGAVALDGRIEPGDMILQVNDISFENFTNDQAVDVLRESVARRGPIKLTVAKMWDGGPRSAFTVPRHRDEPVRPIDTQAWIQHTNAMRGMPSILEGAPTPVPGQYGRPPSSGTMTSNGSAPNTIVAGGIGGSIRLATTTDKKRIVQMMVMPNSGLDIKNRTWLKIPIPMSFLGSDLVDWLMEHVDGLRDRKDGRKFAGELLKEKLISHVVNKITFTEQCYYILGDECAGIAFIPPPSTNDDGTGVRSEVGSILPPPPPGLMAAAAAAQQQQGCPNRVAGVWPSSQQQQQQPGGVVGGVMLQNAPPSMVSNIQHHPQNIDVKMRFYMMDI
uniref:Segment polarity protein dishevelled (inferred by orthology to a D. melanogaster protein) n=1 Tax=Anisakis simplex TaxID=6269 RepID=A0A0M3IZE3_ANISI